MPTVKLATIAALLVATTTAAHADQAHDFEPIPQTEPAQMPTTTAEKSPILALTLSLGATVGGYALVANTQNASMAVLGGAGLLFGPSVGQWYAGQVGGLGIAARSGGALMMLYGFASMISAENVATCGDCTPSSSPPRSSNERRAELYVIAGAGLWIGSTIYDFAQAYHQTDLYNQRQRARAMQVGPTMIPATNNTMAPGMTFAMKF